MFKNMSLAKKLSIGFSVVLILLIIVSGVSYNTIHNASLDFTTYRGLARDTNLMGRVQANMLMIRMNVKDFIITGSKKDLEQYQHYVELTDGFITEAHKEIQNPKRAALVDKADEALKKYEASFKKVEKAREERDDLVKNHLNLKGPFLENTLTEILISAEKDQDMKAAFHSALAMKHLLLGRLYVVKFLDENIQSNVDRVREEFRKMQEQLSILDRELQNPQRRKWLSDIVDTKKDYTQRFETLVKVIFARNDVITNTLDRLGPEIAKAVEDTKLSVKADQDVLGPRVQSANDRAIVIVLILSVVAILLGVLVTIYIVKIITTPIRKASGFAEAIANGDFSQQIEIDQKDEIGVMAKALGDMGDTLKKAIETISETMNRVSQGDLKSRIGEVGMKGELLLIKESINGSVEMLSETISQVIEATNQVNSGASQISDAAQSLASGTSEQAASLEEISSSMAEVGGRANENNENASKAAQLTTEAMETANRGNEQMGEMLASMDRINGSSADISKIIKVIDEIAFQTNLLALNAAVEAARAGKYGKGFAVVAEEVRTLAARSAEAAKTTTELIENSITEVSSGVENADKTAEVLKQIQEGITKVNDLVGEIAASSREQSNSTDEINKSITQVNEVVQQNSSISEESASAAEELSGQSSQLQAQMSRFIVNQTTVPSFVKEDLKESPPLQDVAEKSKVKPPKMITLDDDSFGKY